MEKCINYEDNAFIINTRLRLLNDIFSLDVDPALFFNKAFDELDFINDTLQSLLDNLTANNRLIEQEEQFHTLLETEWRFTSLLNKLISGQGTMAMFFHPNLLPKLESIRKDCSKRQDVIREKKAESGGDKGETLMVSSFELAELLKE
jgi:hypothetical protein